MSRLSSILTMPSLPSAEAGEGDKVNVTGNRTAHQLAETRDGACRVQTCSMQHQQRHATAAMRNAWARSDADQLAGLHAQLALHYLDPVLLARRDVLHILYRHLDLLHRHGYRV